MFYHVIMQAYVLQHCALVWLTSRLRSLINVLSVVVLPLYMHVSKGTLFIIFLLADISDDNKHLAFEVTKKVAFS